MMTENLTINRQTLFTEARKHFKITHCWTQNAHNNLEPQYQECIMNARHWLSLDVSSMTDTEEAVDAVSRAVEEFYECICQGVDAIKNILLEGYSEKSEMVQPHLSEMVSLIHLLIQFLKSALELLTIEYPQFPDLPKTLSQVLVLVFSHCKDSESIYGDNINILKGLLKDLFKSCHELQVLTFVIMDKHFVFDVSNEHSFAIFKEVLDLSVDIGEIVLDLDIQTMAEQWKGYITLSENYSQDLMDNYTFDRCISIFCKTISNNVASLLLDDSEQKLIIRCLKVSSFLMKIIIKLCEVFDKFVLRDYRTLIDLLITLMGLPESYLRACGKSEQLIQKVSSHLGVAALPLLMQLMTNKNMATDYFNFNLSDEKQNAFGYLMLTTNIIKTMLERDTQCFYDVWLACDANILCNFFKQLPKCHTAFALGLSMECIANKSTPLPCGVYEYVLLHTGALAATLDCEGYITLEKKMISSVLQDNFWQSTFASDLWCILARFSPSDVCFDQVTFLIETYNTRIDQLDNSPQQIHLASTIHRLFNTLPERSKCQLLEQFPCNEREHRQVWSAIELSSLPDTVYEQAWTECFKEMMCIWEQLKIEGCSANNIYDMINLINLVSSGALLDYHAADDCNIIMEFWKVLPIIKELPESDCTADVCDESCLVKFGLSVCRITLSLLQYLGISNGQLSLIFDIIISIIKNTSTALKLGLLSILDALSFYKIPDDSNTNTVCQKIAIIFETLLTDKDSIVCSSAFIVFHTFSHHTNKDMIVSETVARNINLKEDITIFMQHGNMTKYKSDLSIEEQLKIAQNFKFSHKCKPLKVIEVMESIVSQSSNKSDIDFDIGDIDMLLTEDTEESSPHIMKFDEEGKINEIISRLNSDSQLLAEMYCNKTELSLANKNKLNAIVTKIKALCK